MAIPFKSLRYQPGADQVWGINLRRVVRWKNEWSYLAPVPRALTTFRGHAQSVVRAERSKACRCRPAAPISK